MPRLLLLTLLAFAVATPAARADVADPALPFRDASDGVEAVMGKRTPVLRFGPQAAKLYRGLAGRKAEVGCGRQVENDDNHGAIHISGGSTRLIGGGYAGTEMRLPREGARVALPFTGDPYDLCYIATPATRADRNGCLMLEELRAEPRCVRVLVALNDAGRARVDRHARMVELSAVGSAVEDATGLAALTRLFGPDVVALEHPDAAPAPGKVGVWIDGATRVVAVTLADGMRKFRRWDGELYATNVPAFTGGSDDFIRLP